MSEIVFNTTQEQEFWPDEDNVEIELQSGVWYFFESGIHTKNGNPIIEGEFRVIGLQQLTEPQSSTNPDLAER